MNTRVKLLNTIMNESFIRFCTMMEIAKRSSTMKSDGTWSVERTVPQPWVCTSHRYLATSRTQSLGGLDPFGNDSNRHSDSTIGLCDTWRTSTRILHQEEAQEADNLARMATRWIKATQSIPQARNVWKARRSGVLTNRIYSSTTALTIRSQAKWEKAITSMLQRTEECWSATLCCCFDMVIMCRTTDTATISRLMCY